MEMSVLEHLDELRRRLLKMVLAVGVMSLMTFWGADWMLAALLRPSPLQTQALTSLQPAGVFIQSLRLALICGFMLALPLVLYHFWGFVSPGLAARERKAILMSLYAGTALFGIGVLFAYFYVIPGALRFFWNYSEYLGVQPSWTIDYYLNFVLMLLLSFGVAFELPLVLLLLVHFHLLTAEGLAAKRPHIIIVIAILAATLTPPDVISQLLLALPLWLLFELSLRVAKWLS